VRGGWLSQSSTHTFWADLHDAVSPGSGIAPDARPACPSASVSVARFGCGPCGCQRFACRQCSAAIGRLVSPTGSVSGNNKVTLCRLRDGEWTDSMNWTCASTRIRNSWLVRGESPPIGTRLDTSSQWHISHDGDRYVRRRQMRQARPGGSRTPGPWSACGAHCCPRRRLTILLRVRSNSRQRELAVQL
jgi:hypothetical protein